MNVLEMYVVISTTAKKKIIQKIIIVFKRRKKNIDFFFSFGSFLFADMYNDLIGDNRSCLHVYSISEYLFECHINLN